MLSCHSGLRPCARQLRRSRPTMANSPAISPRLGMCLAARAGIPGAADLRQRVPWSGIRSPLSVRARSVDGERTTVLAAGIRSSPRSRRLSGLFSHRLLEPYVP